MSEDKVPTVEPIDSMPFSNSTEGCAFTANWCDRCIHDKPARLGKYEDACKILLTAICGKTPGEWIEQAWGEKGPPVDRYHCIEFRDEDDGPPPPTEPEPTPPGQDELFPMDDYVGVRMFAGARSSDSQRGVPVVSLPPERRGPPRDDAAEPPPRVLSRRPSRPAA